MSEEKNNSAENQAAEEMESEYPYDPRLYAETAIYVYASTEDIDTKIMQPSDARKVEELRLWSLRIAHYFMREIYTEIFS